MLCQSHLTHLNSSHDCEKLYQFLDFCRQKSIEEQQTKIASLAIEIEAIDPLAVLRHLAKSDQLHFYIENRDQERAIAAIDTTLSLQLTGTTRFLEAQHFIQTNLRNFVWHGASDSPWTIPRFFCGFTFFDQELETHSPFPSVTVFLPRWQITRWQNHSAAIVNLVIHSQSNIAHLTKTIWDEFQRIDLAQYDLFNLANGLPKPLQTWKIIDNHPFQSTVISALKSIQHQCFDKLVLAHAIDVIASVAFDREQSLHNLRQLHPDCYVFSMGNGKGQSFIGASPERLLSVQHCHLITDALAGSAPRGETVLDDAEMAQRLLSSEKERREHQVVLDFITQRLVQFGLTPQHAEVPTLLQLSNIQHLHTPIQTMIPPDIHPLEILAELHPTPAVAGMPRDIACQEIRQYEPFGRSLYAAPLGWVDAQGNAEFIVGIRSALIDGYRARLYAGAGIVAGSDPDRELAEIRLKFQALLQALV
jgi:menaquinone-specific isochorismate synthase